MQGSNSKEILLWLIRLRQRYRVTGPSMRPLLTTDDEVLVDLRAYRRQKPCIGDIVIAQHPTQAGLLIIKRVKGVHENGNYHLQGDNSDPSQNSPSLIPAQLIQGRVTSLFTSAR
jgi:nickel-type superoxide dismutase maturation protease